MATLSASERAALPDRAFAYVDSRGTRRLPIHDAAHVRNALARFGQVAFEDDAARERARQRLLKAAQRFRIVPVGFITSELQAAGRRDDPALPAGFVTLLMTDVEGSTGLVQRLGGRFGALIDDVVAVLRRAALDAGGHEVEARADEFFAVFEAPRAAVDAAIAMQLGLAAQAWVDDVEVRVRIGIHSGYPTSTPGNYVGIDVNTTSRVCAVGHGGQIVVTANLREAVKATVPSGVRFTDLGSHRLKGLPEAVALFQVASKGLTTRFPPLAGVNVERQRAASAPARVGLGPVAVVLDDHRQFLVAQLLDRRAGPAAPAAAGATAPGAGCSHVRLLFLSSVRSSNSGYYGKDEHWIRQENSGTLGYVTSDSPTPTRSAPVGIERCSIIGTLDALGDTWSVLVLRQLFYGVHRFNDIQDGLGISRSVLADRLARLVDLEVVRAVPYKEPGTRAAQRVPPHAQGRRLAAGDGRPHGVG